MYISSTQYQILGILTVIILILLLYLFLFVYLTNNGLANGDILGTVFTTMPLENGYATWWPITHFILFAFLGFCFPKQFWFLLILGIIWEVIEFVVGRILRNTQIFGAGPLSEDGTQYSRQWLDGRFSDILFDLFGLMIGIAIARLTWNNRYVSVSKKRYSRYRRESRYGSW